MKFILVIKFLVPAADIYLIEVVRKVREVFVRKVPLVARPTAMRMACTYHK